MAPDKAFRNERWDIDELVPWDSLEHTERAVTETARMVGLVNKVFENAKDEVRFLYIIETTRAILGNEWADHMSLVTNMESDSISIDSIVAKIRENKISVDTTEEELKAKLGNSLYTLPSGAMVRQDQANKLMEDLVSEVVVDDVLNIDTFLAAWAFAVTAETSGQLASLHSHLITLFTTGATCVKKQLLDKPMPGFAAPLRDEIRGILQASRAVASPVPAA
jgi:hypothetical protein